MVYMLSHEDAAGLGGALLGEAIGVSVAVAVDASAVGVFLCSMLGGLVIGTVLGLAAALVVELIFDAAGFGIHKNVMDDVPAIVAKHPDGHILALQLLHHTA